ncbi:MAG: bifunctional glycosyltransferase family 2/GtrA family protein [Patescibacteria group bacterium]
MQNPLLSVVIPAYNEAERIEATLLSIDTYLKSQHYTYEIIVVNDGSKDTTAEVVQNLLPSIQNLRLSNNAKNHGKGFVVRQGMLEATGQYRLFMDADNSTTIDHVEQFFPKFEEGYDVVVSSRRIDGSVLVKDQSKLRELLGTIFRTMIHMMVPLGITDSQNGFKMFTAKAAEKIFSKQKIVAWAFDVEILAIAKLFGFKIKEEPITWVNDERTHVTLKGMVRMLKETFQIKLNLSNGIYGMYDKRLGDQRHIILAKFLILGAINTAIDWIFYLALTRSIPFFADHLIIAKSAAFFIGSLPILLTGSYWVFPQSTQTRSGRVTMYAILAAAFFINTSALTSFLVLGVNDILAIVLATTISFAWNLTVSWIFLIKNHLIVIPAVYENGTQVG